MSNPESLEDVVELLVPELQKRGLYRMAYPAEGGTLRENMQDRPGQPLAAADHPAAKVRWDQVTTTVQTTHQETVPVINQSETFKSPAVVEVQELTPAVAVAVS